MVHSLLIVLMARRLINWNRSVQKEQSKINGLALKVTQDIGVKSIAEEVRGLAMEFNVAIVTSSQFNRSAYDSSDVELSNTSESMGITHTADAIFGLISSEELAERNQLMIKQLKNRWGDLSYYKRFVIGIDRSKMKLYQLDEHVQKKVHTEGKMNQSKDNDDDASVFDKSKFSEDWENITPTRKKKVLTSGDIV